MKIGLLKSGVIADVIKVRDTQGYGVEGTDWVDMAKMPPRAGKGWGSDGSTATAPVRVPAYRKLLTTAEFMDMFTDDQFIAIEGLIGVNAAITKAYRRAERKGTVNLASPKAAPVMAEFVREQVITEERAAEIAQGIRE